MSEEGSVKLAGVPQTLLWILYHRAGMAQMPESGFVDPLAVGLVEKIPYPYEKYFGPPNEACAIRALSFDREIKKFLATHPEGTVVALADGLETQFWRVDNGK